jgi:hypothetical protein
MPHDAAALHSVFRQGCRNLYALSCRQSKEESSLGATATEALSHRFNAGLVCVIERRRAPLGAPPTPISLVVGLPVGKVVMLTSTTCWPAISQVLPDSRIEGLRFLSWGIESVYCA